MESLELFQQLFNSNQRAMKKEIKQQAEGIFERMPSVKKLWVNPEGEFFTIENLAKASVKEDENLTVILREAKEEVSIDSDAKTIIDYVKMSTSIEELESLINEESEGKNRKTVIKAIEDRIDELNND